MDDYISRADAIEEISKGVWNVHELIDRIKTLPSAKYITEKPNDAVKASNDVINRADAIDAVHEYFKGRMRKSKCDYDEELQIYVLGKEERTMLTYNKGINYKLRSLPSADAVKVAYICDGRKCDKDCSECFRTLDIEHARDFKRMGDTYYQQESADGEWIDSGEYPWSKCNKCGYTITCYQEEEFRYCPSCGVKMKGGDDE